MSERSDRVPPARNSGTRDLSADDALGEITQRGETTDCPIVNEDALRRSASGSWR